MNERSAALNRLAEEMDEIVRSIPAASSDDLLRLLERLEKCDAAYSWLLDHIPSGSAL